jgi:transcriptional regulator with XRE-family HTH domain
MKTLEFTLAAALRHMLDESGLQQIELAEQADISKGSVTNYAKGRQVPRWSTVQRWAEACDYDPDDDTLRHLWLAAKYGTTPPDSALIARYLQAA